MDHQPAAGRNEPLDSSPDDQPVDVERLRERLAFYESFDRLIQENIARSGELLRESAQLRESAAEEIAAARAEAERQRRADRSHVRGLFSALLDEVVVLQGQGERLARRLADALDELEAAPAIELPPLKKETGFLTLPQTQPLAADEPASWLPLVEATEAMPPEIAVAEPSSPEPTEAEREVAPTVDDTLLVTAEAPAVEHDDLSGEMQPFAPDDLTRSEEPLPFPDVPERIEPAVEPEPRSAAPQRSFRATIVLVHGVPRATTALSLKRYLEGLTYVDGVEPREFAEGVLRLEVVGGRPVAFDDLRGWSEGSGLEALHVRDDLVEVRLGR